MVVALPGTFPVLITDRPRLLKEMLYLNDFQPFNISFKCGSSAVAKYFFVFSSLCIFEQLPVGRPARH